MAILGYLIGGAIIGLLGKFVAPGDKDNVPIWMAVVLGIVGALIGYALFGRGNDGSFDWIAFIVSIIIAAVLVIIASTVMARRKV